MPDSTVNGNNGSNVGVTAASGILVGSGSFENGTSYILLPNSSSLKPSAGLTLEAWVNPASFGNWSKIIGLDYRADGSWYSPYLAYALQSSSTTSAMSMQITNSGNAYYFSSQNDVSLNTWSHVVGTYDGTQMVLYVNGVPSGSSLLSGSIDYGTSNGITIGARSPYSTSSGEGWDGLIEEVRISSNARSADWIATEYNNVRSSSTFYLFNPENAVMVVPATVNLYAGQSRQFTATVACGTALNWTMPSGAPGMLSASGFYTAPASIATQQTVTITATNPTSSTPIGSVIVKLLPPPPPIALVAAAQPPYITGSSQGFIATLEDQYGTPESGVAVTFTVAGVNGNTGSATTDSNGIASFAYIGANAGNDTVQATATVNGQQLTSSTVSVSWTSFVPANAEGSVALQAGVNLGLTGLCGAFADGNGAVIEPIAIGASPRVFVVPSGATQLQLGVVDDRMGTTAALGSSLRQMGLHQQFFPHQCPGSGSLED
ncbi:MAG: LamG-like jellyroll fold domain-containing protein [Terracidiphilus sp.]